MMALSAEDIITQVRQRLRHLGIKLWLQPYYFEGIGSVESELDNLAKEFEEALGISSSDCKIALVELQEGALDKLRSRNAPTGDVTLKARIIKSCQDKNDNFRTIEIKFPVTALGTDVYKTACEKLMCNENDIKIILSGKVLQKEYTLISQGIRNDVQAIILVGTEKNNANIHERVKKAKEDAQLVLSSKNQQLFTMEDQDGNLVHLPSAERDSLILALALYEKGRSALKKSLFEEALLLFLEADEQFSSSRSEILDKIDNYALLNLDIVWCYLCLKSFSYLPDAEKRLKICEENFTRSYGKNFSRLSQLKGDLIGNEKALIMRFHLLQGVLYYHQNKLNDAYEKFLIAEDEMSRLEIDEEKLINMLSMGYDLLESKIALRACGNDIEMAINYVSDRHKTKEEARKRGKKEREISRDLQKFEGNEWINPKSVVTLVEMGFPTEIAAVALKKSKNDIEGAIKLIQNNQEELRAEIPKIEPDNNILDQLCQLGFDQNLVQTALKIFANNKDDAIDLLVKLQSDDNFQSILQIIEKETSSNTERSSNISGSQQLGEPGPSTLNNQSSIISVIKSKIDKKLEAQKAYDRFVEDVSTEEDEYLDVNFAQEKSILEEYKNFIIK